MHAKVFCAIPTRGLIYAKTISGVLENLQSCTQAIDTPYIANGLPMPECFNTPVREFLRSDATHIWFVEEDNEAPPGVLDALLEQKQDIVTLDYNVGKGVSHIHEDQGGQILWCGLGCTLIHRSVFEKISEPWFEVNQTVDFNTGEIREIPGDTVGKKYGGHDVLFFYIKVKSHNIPIGRLLGWKGQHFRATEIQKRELNNGMYTITSL